MLRHHNSLSYTHLLLSDSETESDDNHSCLSIGVEQRKRNQEGSIMSKTNLGSKNNRKRKVLSTDEANQVESKQNVDPDLVKLATKYQKYMKKMAIPRGRLAHKIKIFNWKDLAKTLKNLYGQSFHYLTHMLCKQWDQSRLGSDNEGKSLDAMLKWKDAEDTIWKVEEIHRSFTSPFHLAKLWVDDPEYRAFVDEVLPSP